MRRVVVTPFPAHPQPRRLERPEHRVRHRLLPRQVGQLKPHSVGDQEEEIVAGADVGTQGAASEGVSLGSGMVGGV